jgi:hypothetical protein
MAHLPSEEKRDISKDDLRDVIESTPCIGIIKRQGKDAAGKPLASPVSALVASNTRFVMFLTLQYALKLTLYNSNTTGSVPRLLDPPVFSRTYDSSLREMTT